jgi:hypothetical protein
LKTEAETVKISAFQEGLMKKPVFLLTLLILAALIYPDHEVKNRDKPLKGNWDFKLKKVWEINRVGDDVIGRVAQIMVNEEGILYVNDRGVINYILDQNGKFVKRFGKKGEGPGEIVDQRGSFLVKDMVIISDRTRLYYFTRDGKFLKTVKNNYFNRTPIIFINENEFFSAPYSIVDSPGGIGKVSKINLKTGEKTVIDEFSIFKGGKARSGRGIVVWIAGELAPVMTMAYGNNKLYYGMNNSYKINVADLKGKKLNTFSVERKKIRISARAKKDLFSPSELPKEVMKKLIDSHPHELTYFSYIEIHDPFVYVFLTVFDPPYQQEIDIFSLDGKYQYRSCIRFDKNLSISSPDFSNGVIIKKDYLYVVLEDEEGDIKIVKYKITVPKR